METGSDRLAELETANERLKTALAISREREQMQSDMRHDLHATALKTLGELTDRYNLLLAERDELAAALSLATNKEIARRMNQ